MKIFMGRDQKCVSAKENVKNVKEKSEEKHVAQNAT